MACGDCENLGRRVEELERRLADAAADLAATNAKLEDALRGAKRQANPFAKDQKKPKAQHKKSGRPPGHADSSRKSPDDVRAVVDVPLAGCPKCGGSVGRQKEHEHFVLDFPDLSAIWTKFVTRSGHCDECGEWCSSKHPLLPSIAVGAAATSIGHNLKAFIAQLRAQTGASLGKIADFLKQWFSLPLSRSGILFILKRLSEELKPCRDEIRGTIRTSTSAHLDETGWRVLGESSWLWVATNQNATLFHIDGSRSHEVALELVGAEFKGVLHSDFLRTYDALPGITKSKCVAHLLKHIRDLSKIQSPATHAFPATIKAIFQGALELRRGQVDLTEPSYLEKVVKLEAKLDKLLTRRRRDEHNRRLRNRLIRHRPDILRFLRDPRAEATNNLAERQIRPGVLFRKVSGGHRSADGPESYCILQSVYATCVQESSQGPHGPQLSHHRT
jgi:transposase